jgi:hypothetical protein
MRQAGQVIRLSLLESSCEGHKDVAITGLDIRVGACSILGNKDQKKDQKIAAFGSSYMGMSTPAGAAEGCDLLIVQLPRLLVI